MIVKPTVLYHASQNPGIEEFEPRAESIRDPKEGPVIFATPDKSYASCFLVPTDDSWVIISRFGDSLPWHFIVSDKARFMELDKGGAIYELSADVFTCDPDRNMGNNEWTSKVSVRPKNSVAFGSGLEAMIAMGVLVHFIDAKTFAEINASDDHGFKIVSALPT